MFRASMIALSLTFSATAFAQAPDPKVEGKRLFDEGQSAMERGELDRACRLFGESYGVSQVPGALFNQAECERRATHLLRARELWNKALAVVASDPARVEFVNQKLAELDKVTPRLNLKTPSDVQQLAVTVDERNVDAPNVPVPVDPGRRAVRATGEGYAPFEIVVNVSEGEERTIVLFEGMKAATPGPQVPPVVPPVAPPAEEGSSLTVPGLVVGAIGVGSLIGFGITGGIYLSQCEGLPCQNTRDEMLGLGVTNAVLLGVGVVGVGVGIGLVIAGESSSSDKAASGQVGAPRASGRAPSADVTSVELLVSGSGLGLRGRF